MFKAVITEKTTTMNGTLKDKLAGLLCYIDALKEIGLTEETIKKVVDLGFMKEQKEEKVEKVETILDMDKLKVQKYDLNNMSKEEAKEFIEKEIFKMFD